MKNGYLPCVQSTVVESTVMTIHTGPKPKKNVFGSTMLTQRQEYWQLKSIMGHVHNPKKINTASVRISVCIKGNIISRISSWERQELSTFFFALARKALMAVLNYCTFNTSHTKLFLEKKTCHEGRK